MTTDKPHTQSPYRASELLDEKSKEAALPTPPSARPRHRTLWIVAGVSTTVALLALRQSRSKSSILDAPPELLDVGNRFPLSIENLPVSTPLAPLLASRRPDGLTLLEPSTDSTRILRGHAVRVRFNRVMVRAAQVNQPLTESPVAFDPPVAGTTRWITRSTLSFLPEPSVFDHTTEARLVLNTQTLRSVGGESMEGMPEKTIVFAGGATVVPYLSPRRVLPGDPLSLVFSGRPDLAAVSSQMLTYESGGAQRSLRFSLRSRGQDAQGRSLVDVVLNRTLEPGARIAMLLSPPLLAPYDTGEGEYGAPGPSEVVVELRPRAKIEGFNCSADALDSEGCDTSETPTGILDIGDALRLLATNNLSDTPAPTVTVTPALPRQNVRIQGKRLVLTGDWEPGQVYEVRVAALKDTEGAVLAAVPPLAVRSRGLDPSVTLHAGLRAYEHDAPAAIVFNAVNVGNGTVRYVPLEPGRDLEVVLNQRYQDVLQNAVTSSMGPMAPTSRPNRWGRGIFSFIDPSAQRTSNIALVALQPSQSAESAPTYTIVQRTDLAISARVFQRGVLGWITSIATGRPVDNAQVQVLYGRAAPLAGHTDADGVVWIAAPPNVLIGDVPLAIGASKDSDRSVIRVDPNQSITPSTLGMPASAAARDTDSVAVLFADRGAYRPGDQLHTKIIVRQSPQCRPNARVPCNPDQLRPVMRGQFKVRVIGPTDDAALDEQTVRTNAWGTADTNFHIPASATPGEWRIEVREPRAPSRLLGSMTVTVAEFRPPTMRVDLTGVPATPHAGDPLSATIEARYLFGAVVGRARSNWTLTRRPINNYPLPWSQTYTFADIDSVERSATVAQGELELDATGHATLQTRFTTGSKSREEFTLETEVRDPSGESTAARRTVVVFPAQNEVGIRNTESWLGAGATLDVQAIVIDHVGAAVAGQSVTARIVREGWANYYEWAHPQSDESEAVGDGEGEDDSSSRPAPSYHARRARDEREVARCNLVSDREPIHCRFTPTQPGTYRLEARIVDSSGRETLASDRVYVAAPGEQADRDPPGAPITLSPSQSSYAVGDTARIAFESPWSDAEMLITVAREGVFRTERRRVQAGGNVVEFALTAEMVPNVFAQLSLVRPRTGAPEQGVDLNAPDLRVGACEIGVRPRVSALNVAIALPSATARPGDEVPVEVSVRNADGQPVRSEVALYAVDEGTLRLTSYETPRPGDSFFPRKPARFVLEDLRRVLVSRTELVALPGASGDGSDEGERAMRDERERFDPTPMWLPHLVVGADGIARGRLRLPERPTQYRIIAVANDSGIRTGGASTQLTATRPVVIRPTMPTSVVEGDRFEAVAFVHNPGTEPITAQVKLFLGTQVLADQSVALGAGADSRVSIPVSTTPGQERVELRFEATAQGSTDSRTSTVAVTPRGIIQRAWLAGPVRHERSLEVALGADALSRGANLQLTVASHPFVGLEAAYQAILDAPSRDVDTLVAQIRAYVAYAAIAPTAQIAADTRRRGEQALTDLASHLSESGAIDQQSTTETHSEYNRVEALEAVQAALDAGWTAPPTLKQRLGAGVAGALANGSLNDYESVSMNDLPAFAVHTLGHAGRTQALRMASLYEQKTSLSLFGLSQLALGMPSTDRRRETILREAIQRVMPGLNASNANYISPFANSDPNLTPTGRWSPTNNGRLFETSNRTLAALQLAAVEILPSLTEARAIARVLLQRRYEGHWGSTQDNAWVLTAMAAYAKRYSDNQPPEGSVTLDGVALTELAGASRGMRTFTLPSATVTRAGTHRLTITSESPAFFALSGRWYRAPNAQDQQARGATVALHRVIERENGTVLADGGHVRIGELLRVRLYMFAETILSPVSVIRDPLAGGVIAVDRGLDNTPQASLDALMGTTPEDQTIDPRTYLASQSLPYVSRRLFGANDTRFVIERAPSGLHEFTYAVRATTPGTFTVLPAEVNSPYVRNLVARSTVTTIVIDP